MKGHFATIISNSESGIALEEIKYIEPGWKVQFSFDNKVLVEEFATNEINVLQKVSDEIFLERLLRDIGSTDLNTRIWTSEILWLFIEEAGSRLEFKLLEKAIDFMMSKLVTEENYAVGGQIATGIFEFIWLEKLDKNSEQRLIIKLAKLNKDYLHCYLDDKDYLEIKEVKEFIERKTRNGIPAPNIALPKLGHARGTIYS